MDARGNACVNGADVDFVAGAPPKPGYIKLVTPDGRLRQVVGDIQFPNGMVINPDGKTMIISEWFAVGSPRSASTPDGGLSGRGVFAEALGPDGICVDGKGAVWVGTGEFSVARVAGGGKVLQRAELGRTGRSSHRCSAARTSGPCSSAPPSGTRPTAPPPTSSG